MSVRIMATGGLLALGLHACGPMEPSHGKPKGQPAETPASSADAAASPTQGEAAAAEAAASDVDACHAQGRVLDRRRGVCSADFALATSFTCDRAGIVDGFAGTGFQIVTALETALGPDGDPAGGGEGFTIDQCGESADGRRLVYLVKSVVAGGVERLVVRELEARAAG